MEPESDDYTNCNWYSGYSHERIVTRTGNNGMGGDHPNYSIVEIGQNTEKSPGDLRRLAVTQTPVENHQLTLMGETLMGKIIIMNHNVPTDNAEYILTAQIREKIYYSMISRRLFPEVQKRCRKGTRCTGEQLYINQHIHNESKTRRKNLDIAWIDYINPYDMVSQS